MAIIICEQKCKKYNFTLKYMPKVLKTVLNEYYNYYHKFDDNKSNDNKYNIFEVDFFRFISYIFKSLNKYF